MTLLVIHEENEPQTENPLRGVAYPLTLYASPLSVTPFAFQTAVNLNLWSKPEVWDANRNFTTGRF